MNKVGILTTVCLLLICSCIGNKSKTKETSLTTVDKTPPIEMPQPEGIGPVDIDKSNFFYAGDLIINNITSTLDVCATGKKVIVVNYLGAFDQLHKYYIKVYPSSKKVFAMVRGYMLSKPTDMQVPDSLVVTHLIDMKADIICAPNNNLVGTYNGSYTTKQGKSMNLILTLGNKNQLLFVVKGATSDSMIEQTGGEWQLLDMNKLMISYMSDSEYLSPQASIDYKLQSITWNNNEGDRIILKRTTSI